MNSTQSAPPGMSLSCVHSCLHCSLHIDSQSPKIHFLTHETECVLVLAVLEKSVLPMGRDVSTLF